MMKIFPKKVLTEAEKKFKEVWDVLRNKTIINFSLSIELQHKEMNEPKTFSMEYERASDGSWRILTPTYKSQGEFQSIEVLQAKLLSIDKSVRQYIVENALEDGWNVQLSCLHDAMDSGFSADDLQYHEDITPGAYFGYGYKSYFCAPILATAYAKEGATALAENDLDHSKYCIDRGLFWATPQMFIPEPKKIFSRRASTGGVAKNSFREPVKKFVAELLVTMMPDGGWKSKGIALQVISNELTINHSALVEKGLLKTENLEKTIDGWIKSDPERFLLRVKSKTW
jgi:hypothetical protein